MLPQSKEINAKEKENVKNKSSLSRKPEKAA
jgi:hypothetical protein